MILENSNIAQWKKELDSYMKIMTGVEDFSETMTDDEWLDTSIGQTAKEVVDAELSYDEQ